MQVRLWGPKNGSAADDGTLASDMKLLECLDDIVVLLVTLFDDEKWLRGKSFFHYEKGGCAFGKEGEAIVGVQNMQ